MNNEQTQEEELAGDEIRKVRYWNQEIKAALKREKAYRKETVDIVKIYESAKRNINSFNILYSNTETLCPAVYSSTPRPMARRRFNDADPLGKLGSDVIDRTLIYLLDSDNDDYSSFDELMQNAVVQGLVAGRGVTRFRYEAVLTTGDSALDQNDDNGSEDYLPAEEAPTETIKSEYACGEEVPWDDFLHGYARTWKRVPWVAFRWNMTKDELVENFGALGGELELAESQDEREIGDSANGEETKGVPLATVYEIWNKANRTVYFISPNYPKILKQLEDPYELTGFFPCTKPLWFFRKVSGLIPRPPYVFYEEQAKELNRVSRRINKIVEALKVRGFYDGTIDGLDKVIMAEDNTLLPANNLANLPEGAGLERAIWMMPLQELAGVLQQLYNQREQIKSVIYEVTGISDLIRGSTVASETATAQQLKSQWGTLRLRRMQKEVMRYTRDNLRILSEIAINKFQPKTFAEMTMLPLPTKAQKDQATLVMQKYQQTQQMAQMQPGQAPPSPPPAEIMQVLQSPTWEDILGMLKDSMQRTYRIDIETNSTLDADASEDKANITQLLGSLSQFFQGIGPLLENGTLPFNAAKAIMLAVVRRFEFGPELEEELDQMQAPQPQPDPKDAAVQAQTQAAIQMEQLKQQTAQAQAQIDQQKMQQQAAVDTSKMQNDLQYEQASHQLRMQELQMKMVAHQQTTQNKLIVGEQKMEIDALKADVQRKKIKDPKNADV